MVKCQTSKIFCLRSSCASSPGTPVCSLTRLTLPRMTKIISEWHTVKTQHKKTLSSVLKRIWFKKHGNGISLLKPVLSSLWTGIRVFSKRNNLLPIFRVGHSVLSAGLVSQYDTKFIYLNALILQYIMMLGNWSFDIISLRFANTCNIWYWDLCMTTVSCVHMWVGRGSDIGVASKFVVRFQDYWQ